MAEYQVKKESSVSSQQSLRSNRKGDLYVKVSLEVPTKLNKKQRKAIEDMGNAVTDDCYAKKSGFLDSIKEFFS